MCMICNKRGLRQREDHTDEGLRTSINPSLNSPTRSLSGSGTFSLCTWLLCRFPMSPSVSNKADIRAKRCHVKKKNARTLSLFPTCSVLPLSLYAALYRRASEAEGQSTS